MIQQLRYSIAVFISMVITMGIWAHQVQADDFTRNYRNTSINWTKEIIMSASTADIRITKEGQPLNIDTGVPTSLNRARQAAYLHARNNAIEEMAMSIQHIIVDPDTTMRELLQRETFTQAGLAELIQKRTSSRVYPSGFTTAHCRLSIPMGELLQVIPYTFPEHEFPNIWGDTIPTEYTGLIVDARGLKVKPMLLPSLFDDTGREIFGRQYIHSPMAVRRGTVAYCYNEDDAMRHAKSGNRPFFTIAIRAMKGCPVLSSDDTRKIYSSPSTRKNLKNCNVIIILNREDESS